MIMDDRLEFADDAAFTGTAAATAVLGDVVDLGTVARDMGVGFPVRCRLQVGSVAAAATGGAANVTFKIVSDSVATLDNSPTVHYATAAIAKGTLVAGYTVFDVVLPAGVNYERYLGITFTPDTNDTTSGKANAFLAWDTPANQAYPNGI